MALLCLLLASCAGISTRSTALPQVDIAPAQLQLDISLGQRLSLGPRDGSRAPESFDALLEIDAHTVRLAGFAMGRRVLALHWDGRELRTERAPELPPQVDAARILRDVLYVLAPLDALRAALPKDWDVVESANRRELRRRGTAAIVIDYETAPRWAGSVRFDNRAEGYRLAIDSAGGTAP